MLQLILRPYDRPAHVVLSVDLAETGRAMELVFGELERLRTRAAFAWAMVKDTERIPPVIYFASPEPSEVIGPGLVSALEKELASDPGNGPP